MGSPQGMAQKTSRSSRKDRTSAKKDGCMKNSKKRYPQKPRDPGKLADNLAIWINGAAPEWCDNTLKNAIKNRIEKIQSEISEVEQKINSHHTKTVKGKKYWYFVQGGVWTYVGKVDPRPALEKEKAALGAEKGKIKAEMQSCVVKKHGEHLVVDVEIFKKCVSKKLPQDMLLLSALLRAGPGQDG